MRTSRGVSPTLLDQCGQRTSRSPGAAGSISSSSGSRACVSARCSRGAPRSVARNHPCRSPASASSGNQPVTERAPVRLGYRRPARLPSPRPGPGRCTCAESCGPHPKLAASSCCDRPAYQWIKISTMSITSNVLLHSGSTSMLGNEAEARVYRGPDPAPTCTSSPGGTT